MTKARVFVGSLLLLTLALGAAYVAGGDWDRGRIVGAERPAVVTASAADDRQAFADALEQRFRELTPSQHAETCDSFRAVGLEAALDFIRERHYTQPGGPRMPFYDAVAAEILGRECALVI